MGEYSHYIRLGEGNAIIYAFSDAIEVPEAMDICVQPDTDERHFHLDLFDEAMIPRLRWDHAQSKIVVRSDSEREPLADLRKRLITEITLQARSGLRETDPFVLGYLEEKEAAVATTIDQAELSTLVGTRKAIRDEAKTRIDGVKAAASRTAAIAASKSK